VNVTLSLPSEDNSDRRKLSFIGSNAVRDSVTRPDPIYSYFGSPVNLYSSYSPIIINKPNITELDRYDTAAYE